MVADMAAGNEQWKSFRQLESHLTHNVEKLYEIYNFMIYTYAVELKQLYDIVNMFFDVSDNVKNS